MKQKVQSRASIAWKEGAKHLPEKRVAAPSQQTTRDDAGTLLALALGSFKAPIPKRDVAQMRECASRALGGLMNHAASVHQSDTHGGRFATWVRVFPTGQVTVWPNRHARTASQRKEQGLALARALFTVPGLFQPDVKASYLSHGGLGYTNDSEPVECPFGWGTDEREAWARFLAWGGTFRFPKAPKPPVEPHPEFKGRGANIANGMKFLQDEGALSPEGLKVAQAVHDRLLRNKGSAPTPKALQSAFRREWRKTRPQRQGAKPSTAPVS